MMRMALKTIMMMTNKNWFVENGFEDNYDDEKWEVPWLAEGGVTDLRNHRQQQTDHLLDKNSWKTYIVLKTNMIIRSIMAYLTTLQNT